MTAEKAMYYSAMLQVGLGDSFYQAFDKMLDEEDPLSELTLSLSDCISDVNAVLHILREYVLDHSVNEQVVCDLILRDIRCRYELGKMSRVDVVTILYDIARLLDKGWEGPWLYFYMMSEVVDLYEEGFVSEAVFNKDFDIWWNAEERDVSKISNQWHEQNNPPRNNGFWSKVRRVFRNSTKS